MGIDALALPGAPAATGIMVQLLPRLLAAVLILVVGWLVANFLGQSVLIAAVNAEVPEARYLARAVRWGVLLFAVATTLTQLGIGKEMVLVTFTITFGGLIFALALAFGPGGRWRGTSSSADSAGSKNRTPAKRSRTSNALRSVIGHNVGAGS